MSALYDGPEISHLDVFRDLSAATHSILAEVPQTLIQQASEMVNSAPSIYVLGVGHSGLLSRIFSMKLNHVGLRAYTVFDEINPPFERGSLMVAVSQSGETATIKTLAEKATGLGGSVLAFTAKADSSIGRLASLVVEVPIESAIGAADSFQVLGDQENQNVRGVFFGNALYSLFYAVILQVAVLRGENACSINARHANLE